MLLCLALPVTAEAEQVWVAGGETSSDADYAYIGVILPFAGGRLGKGPVQRYWVDWLRYSFETGSGEVEAEAPGAEAALGYQWPLYGGTFTAYVGAAFRNTSLDSSDAESEVEGAEIGAKFQIEAHRQFERWRTEAIGSFTTNIDAYWVRWRLGYATGWGYTQGVELLTQGGPDYQISQAGLVFGDIPLGPVSLNVKAGVRHTEDVGNGGYVGIELALPR